MDEPQNFEAVRAAENSHLILSVTTEILEKYKEFIQPKHLINHGIGEDFLLPVSNHENKHKHIGLSGNLLREDIDRDILLKIIDQNPTIIFEYWGPHSLENNNIGGSSSEATKTFIESLKQKGVIFHGTRLPAKLAVELQRMDAFLICYDIQRDQSKGTNYHKIMEYLSTGKVIIANNVTAYRDRPSLLQMIKSRNNNHALPRLVKKVMHNLDYYNNPVLIKQRKEYASLNTYVCHVKKIEKIIGSLTEELNDKRKSVKFSENKFASHRG